MRKLNMKKLYFFALIYTVALSSGFAQKTNCTQVLRLARSQYEQGRLHELPTLMDGCLSGQGGSFTKEEKKEAYRLLTLAYIYLEEPEKADETMLALLNTDHFFEINETLDPAEFIALYNKFRNKPVFWGAFKIGLNATQPNISKSYFVGSQASGKGSYGLNPSIQLFLTFEKDILTKKFPHKGVKKGESLLSFAPEIGFVSRGLTYSNAELAFADEDPLKAISSQEFTLSQSWLDFNAIINYKFNNSQQFKTYVGLGPGVSYLLSSNNLAKTVLGNGFTNTGSAVDDKSSYKSLIYSVTAIAGLKYKFGDLYVVADVRYQYGLVSIVDPAKRTNPDIAYNYQGVYNDYSVNNFSINVGLAYPYFKPKKLIK
ncbi:hypothetical protein BH09BAC3_BH09BAC3_20790 [soil metagenome]